MSPKEKRIAVRLDDADQTTVSERAKELGIGLGDYCRQKLLQPDLPPFLAGLIRQWAASNSLTESEIILRTLATYFGGCQGESEFYNTLGNDPNQAFRGVQGDSPTDEYLFKVFTVAKNRRLFALQKENHKEHEEWLKKSSGKKS